MLSQVEYTSDTIKKRRYCTEYHGTRSTVLKWTLLDTYCVTARRSVQELLAREWQEQLGATKPHRAEKKWLYQVKRRQGTQWAAFPAYLGDYPNSPKAGSRCDWLAVGGTGSLADWRTGVALLSLPLVGSLYRLVHGDIMGFGSLRISLSR